MGEVTGIGWTDHTWSPWWGCTQVSPACDYCYAKALDKRVGGDHWGPGKPRREMSEAHWRVPHKWNARVPAGETRFVFPSMCDPFDNEVPIAWRDRFWQTILDTPNLTWLLLTKRVGNVERMTSGAGLHWPSNAMLGATVVTQAEADRDIPKLLDTSGPRLRFVSIEPMLEKITLTDLDRCGFSALRATGPEARQINWVIAGGESGAHHRPMQEDWARGLRNECAAAGVPFFFKQWGGRLPKSNGKSLDGAEHCARPFVSASADAKGGR